MSEVFLTPFEFYLDLLELFRPRPRYPQVYFWLFCANQRRTALNYFTSMKFSPL